MSLVVCSLINGLTGGVISQEFCELMPLMATRMVATDGYGLEALQSESDTGYQFTTAHITTDKDGNDLDDSNGPVLLVHGLFRDGTSWFFPTDDTRPTLPVALADAGYDVYIANLRGTTYSRTHSDPAKDPTDLVDGGYEAYFDWDDFEIGSEDIPKLINDILARRQELGKDCQKVKIVAYSAGVAPVLIGAASAPQMMFDCAGNFNLKTPCLIPDTDILLADLGLPLDDGSRRLNDLIDMDMDMDMEEVVCDDKTGYLGALSTLLGELTEKEFLMLLKDIIYKDDMLSDEYGDDWRCDNNWVAPLQSLVCEDYPCSAICKPENFDDLTNWFA